MSKLGYLLLKMLWRALRLPLCSCYEPWGCLSQFVRVASTVMSNHSHLVIASTLLIYLRPPKRLCVAGCFSNIYPFFVLYLFYISLINTSCLTWSLTYISFICCVSRTGHCLKIVWKLKYIKNDLLMFFCYVFFFFFHFKLYFMGKLW